MSDCDTPSKDGRADLVKRSLQEGAGRDSCYSNDLTPLKGQRELANYSRRPYKPRRRCCCRLSESNAE